MAQVGEELGAGDTSSVWTCSEEWFGLHLTGTFETTTLTIEASPDGGANWYTFYADAADGTPAAQQFTATNVPSGTALYSKVIAAPGLMFKATTNSTGTTPAINVYVTGAHTITSS